jgi:glycine oxidase
MSREADVLIVGGGVIGCAIARELALRGIQALILERGEPCREASWAAAGALIARAQGFGEDVGLDLKLASLSLFKFYCAGLEDETGIDTGYRETGGIDLFLTQNEVQEIETFLAWQAAKGIDAEKVFEGDLEEFEPNLNPEIRLGVYFPGFTQVRTPWFTRAVLASALANGAEIETHTEVREFIREGDRVVGVRTDHEECFAATTILAAGPWSPALARLLGKEVPGVPVKGQIILLEDRSKPVRHIVHHGKTYLTPRDEGRIVVGSTEEWVGFQRRNTLEGISKLLSRANFFFPGLAHASVEDVWHGFRPYTVDGLPFIGGIDGLEGFLCATGHFRSGIILSPITAKVIAELVEGEAPRIDLAPFSPNRVGAMAAIDLSPRYDFE